MRLGVQRRFAGGQQRDLRHAVLSDNWVSASKRRMASRVAPKKSSRSGCSSPGGHRSTMPPRKREIARLAHRAGADIAIAGQERDQRVAVHLRAILGGEAGAGDGRRAAAPAAAAALMVVTMTAGLRRLARQRRQGGQPAAFDIGLGRDPVVGQTVPGRKGQHRHARARKKRIARCAASACTSSRRRTAPGRPAAAPLPPPA